MAIITQLLQLAIFLTLKPNVPAAYPEFVRVGWAHSVYLRGASRIAGGRDDFIFEPQERQGAEV